MFADSKNIQADLVGKLDNFEHILHDNSGIFLFTCERICSAINEVVKAHFKWTGLVVEGLGHFKFQFVLRVRAETQKYLNGKVLRLNALRLDQNLMPQCAYGPLFSCRQFPPSTTII